MENISSNNDQVKKIVAFALCVGATMLFGFLGGYFGRSYIGYSGLMTPPLTPPDIVFAIVWPILYALIGFSLYRVLASASFSRENVLLKQISVSLWTLGIILNITWIPLFFIAKLYTFTFFWLAILLSVTVVQTVINFKIDKTSAVVLIPYALWLAFATYLNLFIALLN